MKDDEVEGCADYFRIKTFRSCGDADVQECVVIFGNAVLENGMGGVQLLQETDESFTGGACRRDTQMDAEQGIHAVVRDDGSYKAVAAAGMAVMKATESFSSWVSLRWKKFRSLSFMYFSKMPAFTFLPGLKLITFAMAPPVRDFIFHSLYYGCT